MTDTKQVPQKQPTGYFVGEVATQMSEVIARPDGTALTDKQWQVEVLNKLDAIHKLIQSRL